MRRLWPFALVALVGLSVGAALDEVRHRVRGRNSDEVFQRRMRCRDLAEGYSKKQVGDRVNVLDRVDYSPSRNSCIAAISAMEGWAAGWHYETVDVITGETLFSGDCKDDAKSTVFCGNGYDMQLREKRDQIFEAALQPAKTW